MEFRSLIARSAIRVLGTARKSMKKATASSTRASAPSPSSPTKLNSLEVVQAQNLLHIDLSSDSVPRPSGLWVEHEGNAADFLFYLSNPDNNTHIAKVCSLPPLHKEAPTLDPSLEEEGLSANLLVDERSDLYAFGQEPMRYQAWEEFQTLGEQGLRDLLAGRVSVEELLDQFDAYWSQALEEEGRLWDEE